MRIGKMIIAGALVAAILGAWTPFCKGIAEPAANSNAEQVDVNEESETKKRSFGGPTDISAYYGFGEMEIIKLNWDIKNLRVADFNGDGRNDIAVVNKRKAKIELLIQKEAIGPDETAVAVDPEDADINALTPPTRFKREALHVSQEVFSLVCGDLNSDGAMDLAFYGNPKGLYVVLQKANEAEEGKATTLSWRTRKKIDIDDGLTTSAALVCADLNNDGSDDLALAGHHSAYCVYVVRQKKDGSLAEPEKYPTVAQILGIEAGDLNGDTINDLVLVTNDKDKPIHVRFGSKTGQLGPQEQFFIEKPYALRLHNIDGLAGDELLAVDAISGRLTCYEFTAIKEQDTDWPILFFPLTSGKENTKRDLVTGDFNGDGLVDITISEPGAAELVFYKQIAGHGLDEPVRFPAFADITSLSVADIDDDAKAELAVLSVKEKVIGISEFENERLSFPQPVELTGEPLAMELADLNGDERTDCVYISKDPNDTRLLKTIYSISAASKTNANKPKKKLRGKKTEFNRLGPSLELKELASNPDGLKVVDVDQDGLKDVVVFRKYETPILIHQSKNDQFEVVTSPNAQSSLIKNASLRSIAIADVDGKAGEELLVAQSNFARSLVFADGKRWSIVDQYNAKSTENEISAVAVFDIDAPSSGNRPAILLLDGQKGRLQILKAGDDKTYRFEKELSVGKWNAAEHLKCAFVPLTGSDAKSILLFDSEKFALITPPSSSNVPHGLEQRFGYETLIKDGVYGNLTAGDINADERTDIVMVEYKQNHIEILSLDADMKPIPAMRFKVFEQKTSRNGKGGAKFGIEPRELEIADVTGDGKDDLVTIVHDRIIIYPQD